VLLEVDVEPLATCRRGVPGSMAHQGRGNALSLMFTGDLGIEEEGVIASVPSHVDKTDQAAAALQASGHPAKAVGLDLVPPPGRGLAAVRSDQGHHFRVGDWSAPAILNRLGRHMRDRPASAPQASTSEHVRAAELLPTRQTAADTDDACGTLAEAVAADGRLWTICPLLRSRGLRSVPR